MNQNIIYLEESIQDNYIEIIQKFQNSIKKINSFSESTKTNQSTQFQIFQSQTTLFGGSFNYIHIGHKLLLQIAILVTNKKGKLTIGLTSDQMMSKKQTQIVSQKFQLRKYFLKQFCQLVNEKLLVDILELNDVSGPAKDQNFDCLVVSYETLKGAKFINELRTQNELQPLKIYIIQVLNLSEETEDNYDFQQKISSTSIRDIIIKKINFEVEIIQYLSEKWDNIMLVHLKIQKSHIFSQRWFSLFILKYSDSWRYYHTLKHIYNLFKKLEECAEKIDIQNIFSIELAIFFHDIIYNPTESDNEKLSVEIFKKFTTELFYTFEELEKKIMPYCLMVMDFIQQTSDHFKPLQQNYENNQDIKLFLDIDLSILSEQNDIYDEYIQNIEKEYSFLGQSEFLKKRLALVKKVFEQKRIYQSKYFQEKYEQTARNNLQNEIFYLTNKLQK